MHKEKLEKHVKLCRKNLKSDRVKCCAECPFEDEIVSAYPDMEKLFKKKRDLQALKSFSKDRETLRTLKELKSFSKEVRSSKRKALNFLVKAGICTKKGNLRKAYR